MASTIDNIDSYLKKNKKPLFANLNNWYGKNDSDANILKSKWNRAQEAKGINNKIKAFKELQEEIAKWTDLEELEAQEAELQELGKDNWTDPQAKVDLDQLRFFGQLSNYPEISETDDLDIKDIYEQNYNQKQLKALAAKYGYDYDDKEERAEFLKNAGEVIRKNEVEKIWDNDTYAGLVAPISKEYAKKNYDKIDGYGDMVAPYLADVGVGTLMAGVPGGAVSKYTTDKGLQAAADYLAAPLARQYFRWGINDVDAEEAAKDAVSEIATNVATPYALRRPGVWLDRLKYGEAGVNAQKYINNYANKARETARKINEGQPFMERIVESAGSTGGKVNGKMQRPSAPIYTYKYKRYNPNTKQIETISSKEYSNAKQRITDKEMDDYSKFVSTLRGKKSVGEQYVQAEHFPKIEPAGEYKIENKMYDASIRGQDPLSVLSPEELKAVGGLKGKETLYNWATSKPPVSDLQAYLTNLQGRSKYGGMMLGSIAQFVPGSTSTNYLKTKPKVDQSDPEVKMYKRNYLLYQDNKDLVAEPKKPEKYKDYSIKEIFGE
jgi:hypothetical protein